MYSYIASGDGPGLMHEVIAEFLVRSGTELSTSPGQMEGQDP